MPQINLDCQNLPCPQPVLRCKEAIEKDAPDTLVVTVDNEAARQNVSRFLSGQGYTVSVDPGQEGYIVIRAERGAPGTAPEQCEVMSDAQLKAATPARACVFITADVIGKGDDALGAKLMGNFLATLPELDDLWRIILVNGGVKLAAAESPALEKLQKLADAGVSILVCGTCLDHFGLMEKKAVGETTNMLDVVTSLGLATKVIQV